MGMRLKSSPAAGSAFIKTGSLNAVRAIAGYVRKMEARPAYQRALAKGGPVIMSS